MKDTEFERLLVATRPADRIGNEAFVERVMSNLHRQDSVIISNVVRSIDEQPKKGLSFMKKLRSLPAGVLVLLVIAAAGLTGGVACAVYEYLWKPLHVEQVSVEKTNDSSKIVFSVEGCTEVNGGAASSVEVKIKDELHVSADEAKKYIMAGCQQTAIEDYAHTLEQQRGPRIKSNYTNSPVTIREVREETEAGVFTVASDPQYIVGGKLVSKSAIHDTDLVAVLVYKDSDSTPDSPSQIIAYIKLNLPAKYYVDGYQYRQSVDSKSSCYHNADDMCSDDWSWFPYVVSLPETGPLETDHQKALSAYLESGDYTHYEGTVKSLSGNTFVIETSSGRTVTITAQARGDGKFSVGYTVRAIAIGSPRSVITNDQVISIFSKELPK